MIFGRRRRQNDESPDRATVEEARARYVLRTAEPPVLERILGEVEEILTEQARAGWARRLAEEGLTVHPPAALATDVVDAVAGADEEARNALSRSATDDVVAAIGRASSAAPAFSGFPSSPEAREIGVPDPEVQAARAQRRAEPPYLPGTNPGGRR